LVIVAGWPEPGPVEELSLQAARPASAVTDRERRTTRENG